MAPNLTEDDEIQDDDRNCLLGRREEDPESRTRKDKKYPAYFDADSTGSHEGGFDRIENAEEGKKRDRTWLKQDPFRLAKQLASSNLSKCFEPFDLVSSL